MADDMQTILIKKPGVLGFGQSLPALSSVQAFCNDETVVQASCGERHSVVVCDSGRVYTFGMYATGVREEVDEPRLVTSFGTKRITQAVCGYRFTIFLGETGEIYSWGSNNKHQLGLIETEDSPFPVMVTGLPRIKKVAAGFEHTVVLADSGKVWVTGDNSWGQLGSNVKLPGNNYYSSNVNFDNAKRETSFKPVVNLWDTIIDIACGGCHTVLLSTSRVVFVAGHNEFGQLGLGTDKSLPVFTPLPVPSSAVASISCGFNHTVALAFDGMVWSWGCNEFGQLGTGIITKRSTITEISGLENHTITEVIAGWKNTALLTSEGDVLVCGRGQDGELGQGKENLLVPTLLPKSPEVFVKQIAFADAYSLVLAVPKSETTKTLRLQHGVPSHDCQAMPITVLEKRIMSSLECPICFRVMCAPIHQCINGHSLCNACRFHQQMKFCPICRGAFGIGRNITLESLGMEIELPCIECLQRMPTCELGSHSKVCLKRKYRCPVKRLCPWNGRSETVLAHTSSAHPHKTWRDLPHFFLHSTSDKHLHTVVLSAYNQVFTLHRKYDIKSGKFEAAVRYVGTPENKDDFMFQFALLINDSDERIYRRNISADTEEIEHTFKSPNCLSIERESLIPFLQRGHLVCRAEILDVKRTALADSAMRSQVHELVLLCHQLPGATSA